MLITKYKKEMKKLTVSTTNEHRLIDGFFIDFANPCDFLLNNGSPRRRQKIERL